MDTGQISASRKITFALIRILGDDRYDINTADHNVGLIYLAEAAENAGAQPTIFDPLDLDELAVEKNPLLAQRHDVYGFTTHCLNIQDTLSICKVIKCKYPDSLIVLGGHQAAGAAPEVLAMNSFVDVVCVGEGEQVVDEIISDIRNGKCVSDFRRKGIYKPKSFINLSKASIPVRNNVYPIMRISTSRGCPFNCSFCTTPSIRRLTNQPTYRERGAKSVVDEMEILVNKGVRKIYLNDDMFVVSSPKSRQRALEIASEIRRRNLAVKFKAQLRVDSFSSQHKHILEELKMSGFREVFMGIESGSNLTLERYNKSATVKDNIKALNLYDEVGIKINAGNIVAAPDSNIEEICQSIKTFEDVNIAYLFFRRVTFRALAFPGTMLEQRLEMEDRLEKIPRYLLRNYRFKNQRVGDIVEVLETKMPYYLSEVGGKLFKLRNRAILQFYENREKGIIQKELLPILNNWSNISAKILYDWFSLTVPKKLIPNKLDLDFDEYIAQSHRIAVQLQEFVDLSKMEEFDNDSF